VAYAPTTTTRTAPRRPRDDDVNTLRLGLIGVGYWGPHYARLAAELGETQLVAACDISQDAIELIRTRYPGVRTSRDPADVIEANDVDAVIVSTPTSTHYTLSLAALEHGKHVLCEKPLAMTTGECDELIAAADRAGLVLSVGHTFIFNPGIRMMRELIADGEVGRVLYCHTIRTGLGPIRTDVNALWDLAPHDLSILFYLIDSNPVAALATGQAFLRKGFEDVAFLHVDFESGAMGAAHVSWLDPHKVRRVTVVGDRRMIVFDDVEPVEKVKVFDRGASYEATSDEGRGADFEYFKALIRDGDIYAPKVPGTEPLRVQLAHFADCCLHGAVPEADGASARRVVSLLETATASLRAGGMPMPLEPAPLGR
jgi:predicted dehydrogenase